MSQLFFDQALGGFYLRDEWFIRQIMHQGIKDILHVLPAVLLLLLLLSIKVVALKKWRKEMVYISLAVLISGGIVSGLKTLTGMHCPRQLSIFGGTEPYVRLLEDHSCVKKPGRCWPSGHAAGGYGFFAFYFVCRRRKPQYARVAFWIPFTIGTLLGFGRVMQGAHFVTHNIWTGLICWTVASGMAQLMLNNHLSYMSFPKKQFLLRFEEDMHPVKEPTYQGRVK